MTTHKSIFDNLNDGVHSILCIREPRGRKEDSTELLPMYPFLSVDLQLIMAFDL